MKSIAWLASFATILGVSIRNVVLFWTDSSFWAKFFLVIVVIASFVLAAIDLGHWWRTRAKRHRSCRSVDRYMLKLLRRGGSASIFANHLSWVREAPEIHNFLRAQARGGRQISIFVPEHNDLTRSLAQDGVRIHTYEGLAYEPGSRFTLLNPDEPGSSLLAIGRGIFPNFYIEEFSDETHSRVLAVVRDLLNIVERINERVNA